VSGDVLSPAAEMTPYASAAAAAYGGAVLARARDDAAATKAGSLLPEPGKTGAISLVPSDCCGNSSAMTTTTLCSNSRS
jgi:hypothetical protein